MITNERQYKITKNKAEKFREALADATSSSIAVEGVHPRIAQAEREALQSQLNDLLDEIVEYEDLKSSSISVISVSSFEELAIGLIKARIASGLSQKDLAERLGLKEQQIQRYEAYRYSSASYQRLQQVADALDIRIRNDILLPVRPNGFGELMTKLGQVGLRRDFVLNRLLPSANASIVTDNIPEFDENVVPANLGAVLERVFGWSREMLHDAHPLTPPRFASAEARFKMPARRSQGDASLYAAYANYLAVVTLKGSQSLGCERIPTDAAAMRTLIVEGNRECNLRNALNLAWNLGVPVLPLSDGGTFHGACWRYEKRNVIVLKQKSKYEARWLFDLLHELFHAAQNPEDETLEIIEDEETSSERRNSDEEIAASQFAGEVMLDGRAEELAQTCVKLANNSVERLKRILPEVADRENIDVGALANYMAFRLSWQGVSWWGAAANLQSEGGDPWTIARDVFFERFPFDFESNLDREILNRALR